MSPHARISVLTLLAYLLRTINEVNDTASTSIERDIKNILLNSSPASTNTVVATSQIPCFDSGVTGSEHGFRRLGSLADLTSEVASLLRSSATPAPSTTLHDFTRVLVAMDSTRSETFQYAGVWRPHGISMEHHFLLIFMIPPPHNVAVSSSFTITSSDTSNPSNMVFSPEELQSWNDLITAQTAASGPANSLQSAEAEAVPIHHDDTDQQWVSDDVNR